MSILLSSPVPAVVLKYNSCPVLQMRVGYTGLEGVQKKVDDAVFQSLVRYKSSDTTQMNKTLRKFQDFLPTISTNKIINDIHAIDSIFESLPELPYGLLLFRGSTLNFRQNRPYEVNEVGQEWTYTSTTLNILSAYKYAQPKVQKDRGQILVYYFAVDADRKAIAVCDPVDEEVLLPRRISFKVMDTLRLNEDTRISLSLVQICNPKGSCEDSIRKDVQRQWVDLKVNQLHY